MPPDISEWSNLILRWIHVFVAILWIWIGQTYYFTKLDLRLNEEEQISNHFTGTYSSSYNWLILSALILAGGITAKIVYYP